MQNEIDLSVLKAMLVFSCLLKLNFAFLSMNLLQSEKEVLASLSRLNVEHVQFTESAPGTFKLKSFGNWYVNFLSYLQVTQVLMRKVYSIIYRQMPPLRRSF